LCTRVDIFSSTKTVDILCTCVGRYFFEHKTVDIFCILVNFFEHKTVDNFCKIVALFRARVIFRQDSRPLCFQQGGYFFAAGVHVLLRRSSKTDTLKNQGIHVLQSFTRVGQDRQSWRENIPSFGDMVGKHF
jgi:hypothetical protein